MRQLYSGAQRHVPQVRYVRQHHGVFVISLITVLIQDISLNNGRPSGRPFWSWLAPLAPQGDRFPARLNSLPTPDRFAAGGDETLAGVLVCLHQRRNLIQRALILGLDLHAGDDELSSVRVDVSDERGRHRCQYQAPWRNFPSPLPAR